MPRYTVLIPTHDHGPTLVHAIASVQWQRETDWELLIVGDGAPTSTDALLAPLIERDPRIRWFPNPKGEGHGELWRHQALQLATGEFVCYLADDDLWLPEHLTVMAELLAAADFAKTVHFLVDLAGRMRGEPGDLSRHDVHQRMLTKKWNCFGPTCAGHTLAAYRRLPHGWRPRPDGMWSDLWMWRQWLEAPGVRFNSGHQPSTVHFPSPERKAQTLKQRCDELLHWRSRIVAPGFREAVLHALIGQWEASSCYLPEIESAVVAACHRDVPQAVPAIRMLASLTPICESSIASYRSHLVKQGQLEMAEDVVHAALRRDPQRAVLRFQLVYLLIERKQPTQARALLAELAPLLPERATLLSQAGWLAHRAGDADLALAFCLRSLALDPANASTITLHQKLIGPQAPP